MYAEDDYIMLSALQHLLFCPRQCALIHLEQQWEENALTVQGHLLHEKVHSEENESRGDIIICRGVRLASAKMGLSGQADVVEFHRSREEKETGLQDAKCNTGARNAESETGAVCNVGAQNFVPLQNKTVPLQNINMPLQNIMPLHLILEGKNGFWRPFPVEYKRGRPKKDNCDAVQLCAQALCLEEMLGLSIKEGALYYGSMRKRIMVEFTEKLREETISASEKLHELFQKGITPKPEYSAKCKRCSLKDKCMPEVFCKQKSRQYLNKIFEDVE